MEPGKSEMVMDKRFLKRVVRQILLMFRCILPVDFLRNMNLLTASVKHGVMFKDRMFTNRQHI
jgi:hypothetical protein